MRTVPSINMEVRMYIYHDDEWQVNYKRKKKTERLLALIDTQNRRQISTRGGRADETRPKCRKVSAIYAKNCEERELLAGDAVRARFWRPPRRQVAINNRELVIAGQAAGNCGSFSRVSWLW